jgi:hypothetical protein
MGHANTRLPFDLQADQHGVKRHTPDERAGAVYGVNIPAMTSALGSVSTIFFADNSLARKPLLDPAADQFFSLFIGNGHRRIVGLELRPQVALEIA